MTNKKAKTIYARCLRHVLGMSWGESYKYANLFAKEGYYYKKDWEEEETAGIIVAVLNRHHDADFAKFGVSIDSNLIIGTYSDPQEIITSVKVFKDGKLLFDDWF